MATHSESVAPFLSLTGELDLRKNHVKQADAVAKARQIISRAEEGLATVLMRETRA